MTTALQHQLKMAVLQLRAEVAAIRLHRAARRLTSPIEHHYRHDQPRAPRGTHEGGQWVDDPSVDTGRTRVAANDDAARYFVDLEEEDRKGGHAYREHVGRTRAQLLEVMKALNFEVRNPDGTTTFVEHPAEGTFYSAGEASFFVQQALSRHPQLVEQAVNGSIFDEPIKIVHRSGSVTGLEAYQEGVFSSVVFRPTYSVTIYLAHDPNKRSRGYRILTAYPMNNKPNEELR